MGCAGPDDSAAGRAVLGGRRRVLPGQPGGAPEPSPGCTARVGTLRGGHKPGLAPGCRGLLPRQRHLRGAPPLPRGWTVGRAGPELLQGHVEVHGAGLQVLRGVAGAPGLANLRGAGAVRGLRQRPGAPLLRPRPGVSGLGTGGLPSPGGEPGQLHLAGLDRRGRRVAGGQGVLRGRRPGPAAHRGDATDALPGPGGASEPVGPPGHRPVPGGGRGGPVARGQRRPSAAPHPGRVADATPSAGPVRVLPQQPRRAQSHRRPADGGLVRPRRPAPQ